MFDPEGYESSKVAPDKVNFAYVPKLTSHMSWDFTEGSILDFGCGPGNTALHFLMPHIEGTNSQLYSVDISPKMVEYAKKHHSHPRVKYQLGSFPDNFPFEDKEFDKVFAINVFHYVKNIEETLRSIASVLKPGGQLGFTSSTINNVGMKMVRYLMDSPVWGEYMAGCEEHIPEWSDVKGNSPKEYFRKIFTSDAGLNEVYFEYINTKIPFEMEPVLNACLSMNPCLPNVPKDLRDEIKEEYRQHITSDLGVPLESTSFMLPVEYMCAVLEKPLE